MEKAILRLDDGIDSSVSKGKNVLNDLGFNPYDFGMSPEGFEITGLIITDKITNFSRCVDRNIKLIDDPVSDMLVWKSINVNEPFRIGNDLQFAKFKLCINVETGDYYFRDIGEFNTVNAVSIVFDIVKVKPKEENIDPDNYIEVVQQPFHWKAFGIIMLIINFIMIFTLLVNAFTTFVLKI